MAIIVRPLEESSREWQDLYTYAKGIYLNGECYTFAAALSRALDWPMIGLMEGDTVAHAAVLTPEDKILDVRGIPFAQDDPEFGRIFNHKPPYDDCLQFLLEEDFPRPFHERHILIAQRYAQQLWPSLPWPYSRERKVQNFLEGLERLCTEHDVSIFTPNGGSIFLEDCQGGEAGFEGTAFPSDGKYIIKRILKNEGE
ncbi:MAG: hypothetical protein AB203_02855 [Parcubacteria bacterium C7867-008]|nr:MAG: hypothetical protein AB203_02855 [Parcubacteria bacterium C7867-008]